MDDENFLLAIAGKDVKPKDGQSVTKEMVSEAVKLEMENRWDEITAMIPEPEKGEKGEDADPEAVATALLGSKEFLSRTGGPEGPAGKSVDVEDVIDALMTDQVFCKNVRGEDGKDATDEQVKARSRTIWKTTGLASAPRSAR